MRFKHLISVSALAVTAAGLTVVAQRFDQLWLVMAALSGAFAGGGVFLHLKGEALSRELDLLREHLESTRQHAALLARHTRELREAFVMSSDGAGAERSAEFATLSALVRDIADGVSELDRRTETTEHEIADLRRMRAAAPMASTPAAPPAPPRWVQPARPMPAAPMAGVSPQQQPMPAHHATGISSGGKSSGSMSSASVSPLDERGMREVPTAPRNFLSNEPPRAVRQLVAAAIAADRFDLYLQRIVGLPQRRIRGYDVTLRPDGSDLTIANSDIRHAVEAVGHQLAFDRKLMIQAVRLARVFEQRDRDVVLFVDISQRFLMSEAAFDDLDALIRDVPKAPQRIVLCLPQRFFKKAVAFEHEALRTLERMGFSFMMRDIEDLDLDSLKLSQMGVRWLRMSAGAFIQMAHESETLMDVASADFVTLLGRRRLSFVADTITEEAQVAELIDLNVEFAQGNIFAPPQAVRADVLETSGAAGDPIRGGQDAQPERRSLRDLARRA